MRFQWQPETIRFMEDASERSDFYQELAARLTPFLRPSDHVCDAGCGLGYLSLALAPHVRRVTAIDRSPEALAVLRRQCEKRKIVNISPWLGDLERYDGPRPFQAMVFCRYGRMEEILSLASRLCQGKVLVVKREDQRHRFSVGRQPLEEPGAPMAAERLAQRGIPCEKVAFQLSLDQPFRSWEAARRFFEIYNRAPETDAVTDAFLTQRLQATGDPAFPYLLPSAQSYGLLSFDAKAIPRPGCNGESSSKYGEMKE